ncbi:MAG: c-type cytochrome [Pseudomonadota bacterium]
MSADLRRGEKLFRQCVVCHAIEPGVTIGQGPSLNGVWGRASAAVPGFAYSSALAAADIKWSVRAMDAWVAQPLRLVPGSQMSFGGLHAKRDRNDLLAYMLADERFWDEAER